MRRITVTRKSMTPLFSSMGILIDGEEVARVKHRKSVTIDLTAEHRIMQAGHQGAVSVKHDVSKLVDGDHLEIVRLAFSEGLFLLPYEFRLLNQPTSSA